jgi:hypothetical protein
MSGVASDIDCIAGNKKAPPCGLRKERLSQPHRFCPIMSIRRTTQLSGVASRMSNTWRATAPMTTTVATPIHNGRGSRIEKRRGSGVTGSAEDVPSVYRRRVGGWAAGERLAISSPVPRTSSATIRGQDGQFPEAAARPDTERPFCRRNGCGNRRPRDCMSGPSHPFLPSRRACFP